MEIETAARKMLLDNDAVNGYVVGKVFKFSLLQHVDGTGGLALVVRRSNGWTVPDEIQTPEFPILIVDCWADCDRVDGEMVSDNAVDKAFGLYRVVDKLIHGIADQWWGARGDNPGLRIIRGSRGSDPYFSTSNDAHSPAAGGPVPQTPTGNSAVVTAQYNLQVVHYSN